MNLVLVRHGQSEWNALNLFTGWKDPGLTDQGRQEANQATTPTATCTSGRASGASWSTCTTRRTTRAILTQDEGTKL